MGSLNIVGLGPGAAKLMTYEAMSVIDYCDCVVGYELYLKLIPREMLKGKRVISSGMRGEVKRCRLAIQSALDGLETAIVCSGDPGVYAMASLTIELLAQFGPPQDLPVRVIPGVPALCAGAALLGAPIGHDFACVSLSDLLTPWETIEKRADAALAADFVLVLYNPRSSERPDNMAKILKIARRHRGGDCPVGVVRNISRNDQSAKIYKLDDFDTAGVDMLCLVIIGNSETRIVGDLMLTPRGYAGKYAD